MTLRPRRDDHGHRRTESHAHADRRGSRTNQGPLGGGGRGLEPRSGIRGIARAVPTILTTLGARRGPGPANWHDRGRPRCTSAGPSMRVLDVSGLDRVPLVDARSRRPSRPVVQFDRGAGLRAPGPRSADDHVDRDLQLVDVSGLDRVPLVDGDRADVSGRHAHAHTSAHAHAHEHDAHAHDTSAHARPPNPAYTGNGCKVKLSYIIPIQCDEGA